MGASVENRVHHWRLHAFIQVITATQSNLGASVTGGSLLDTWVFLEHVACWAKALEIIFIVGDSIHVLKSFNLKLILLYFHLQGLNTVMRLTFNLLELANVTNAALVLEHYSLFKCSLLLLWILSIRISIIFKVHPY